MSNAALILVTGASGLLGSHIVLQLLEQGYRVRAIARGPKAAKLQEIYANFGYAGKFEAFSITDISKDQFPEAFEGVYAVIHSAAPLPERASPEEILEGAIEGTLNVVRQAHAAGIKRVVVTSSMATVRNSKLTFTDQDWNPITVEEAVKSDVPFIVYAAAKTRAEQELWKFADSNPEIDVTTINPPVLYGPFASSFQLPSTPDYGAISTNLYISRFLDPSGGYPFSALYADVRDVAKAHVLALKSPLSTEPGVGRKRLIMGSPHDFDYDALRKLIETERPHLKDRITQVPPPDVLPKRLPTDPARLESIIGFRVGDYQKFEDTMLGAVDAVLKLEDDWKSKGHRVQVPLK